MPIPSTSPRWPSCRSQLLDFLLDLGADGQRLLALEIDADRERPHQGRLAAADDLGLFLVDPGLDRAVDGVEEVLAMIAQVKAEQVVAQQAVEQLFLPGEDAKRLAVGPGDVPELGDDQVGIALLEIARQQSRSGSPG